jgi:hypothetical protein
VVCTAPTTHAINASASKTSMHLKERRGPAGVVAIGLRFAREASHEYESAALARLRFRRVRSPRGWDGRDRAARIEYLTQP